MLGAIKSLSIYYTALAINTLETLFLGSLYYYYRFYFDKDFKLESGSIIVILYAVIMLVGTYLSFFYNDKWKNYASEFKKWPKKKNILGGIIVCIIIIFIIANFIYADNLSSELGWTK